MSRCAVVETSNNIVVNIIICDPSDSPPLNCILIDIDTMTYVDIGWIYDPATGSFSPPPPPPEQ